MQEARKRATKDGVGVEVPKAHDFSRYNSSGNWIQNSRSMWKTIKMERKLRH